jgi:nicotinate-nucleotide adenylyltransferase
LCLKINKEGRNTMCKIGVYVGSFNPVHKGHIKVINHLLENNFVDKVLVLATPNYWDKQNLVSAEHRINMLKFFETDKIIIDDVHNKYEFTYEVLNSLEKDYPNDELFLIVGYDNLEYIPLWKNADIVMNHNIIAVRRYDIDITDKVKLYDKNKLTIIDDFDSLDVCSTEIRNNLNNNYLDDRVKRYIIDNNLYE